METPNRRRAKQHLPEAITVFFKRDKIVRFFTWFVISSSFASSSSSVGVVFLSHEIDFGLRYSPQFVFMSKQFCSAARLRQMAMRRNLVLLARRRHRYNTIHKQTIPN